MSEPLYKKSVLKSRAIPNSLTEIAVLDVSDNDTCGFEIAVITNALSAFSILGRFKQDGSYQTLYSTAGDFISPTGLLVGTSGDLTVIPASATGWLIMECSGLDSVQLKATSGNAAGSGVTVKGSAK